MKRRWKTQLFLFFAVLGPGFITANVDNDAGGILTYSQAGAQFGYTLLWTIIPITLALIVVQEMCARMGAVTGKGLSDLIREEFGLRITFVMMILLVIVNFGNVIAEFSGIAGSMQLFHISKYISVPICAALVWLLVVKGDYKGVEKVFLVASVFYIAYIFAGVLSGPSWHTALLATVKLPPRACMAQFVLHLYDGGRDRHDDLAVDAVLYAVIGGGEGNRSEAARPLPAGCDCRLIFHRHRGLVHYRGLRGDAVCPRLRRDSNAADAAEAHEAAGGPICVYLYSRLGCSMRRCLRRRFCRCRRRIPFAKAWGLNRGWTRSFSEAPAFYWLYTLLIAAGAAVVLWPNFPWCR